MEKLTRLQTMILTDHYDGNIEEYNLQMEINEKIDMDYEYVETTKLGVIFEDELANKILVRSTDNWHVIEILKIYVVGNEYEIGEEIDLKDFVK